MPGSTIQFTLRADTSQGVAALEKMRLALGEVGDQATKSQKQAAAASEQFGSVLNSVKGIVAGLGVTFGALAIGSQIREWTQQAMEGEKAWANVRTLLDETKVNAGALYDQLKNVSAEFGTTAELAKGMYLALSANIDPSKSVKFVEDAAKFAKAAVTDTYTSVDLLTTVINAYGLKVEDTTHVSDILFQMVRKGKTTGDELAHSLGMVIPTAAALKVDLGQLGAAFATMTQMGLSAQITTTSVNQALLAFLNPSAQAKKLAKELHVEIDAAALKTKGLAGALGDLAKASKGNDEAIATFFGNVRALRAALALTGEQAGTYTEYLKDMGQAAGLTDEAFKKQTATLKDQLEALWTNLGKTFKSLLPDTGSFAMAVRDLNGFLEGGAAPINAYTVALTAFGVALVGLKIAAVLKDWDGFKTALSGATTNMGLFGKAASVAGAAILGWNIGRWIADLTGADEALTKLWNKLGLFNGDVKEAQQMSHEALRKEAEALEKRARSIGIGKEEAAYGIDILQRSGWEDPQKYVDRIKPMLDAYDKINKLAQKKTATQATEAAAVHQLTEEEKKLQEAWLKEIQPMSAITKDFEKYAAVGATVDQYTQAHWQDIVKATEAQKDFQQPLSKLDEELYNSSLIWKKADDAMQAWHESLKDIKDENMPEIGGEIQALINKQQEAIGKLAEKPRDPMDSIYLPKPADIRKAGDAANLALAGVARDGKDIVAEQFNSIFNDWVSGIADAIVEWKGFWGTIAGIAKSTAKGLLRTFLDELLRPLQDKFKELGKTIGGWIKDVLSGSKSSGSSSTPTPAGIFGLSGKSATAVQTGLIAGGSMAFMDAFQRKGALGWGEAIGGGAAMGASIGSMIPVIGTAVGAAIGAAVGGIAKGIQWIGSLITGKSSGQAGAMEVARDFGGINMTEDQFTSYYQSLGLTDATSWNIRKDISSAPKFLIETLYPMAQAQGKVDAFLKSLEAVKTSWGTFNFRAAFELGNATGDWTELNNQFIAAFKNSKELNANLPNWGDLLLGTSQAITDLEGLKSTVQGLIPQTKHMFDDFITGGIVTDELSAYVEKLGGDIEKFKAMADLTKEDKTWDDLVQHFKDTGELLPDLISMYQKWGGEMPKLDAAAALPGLHKSLDFITELTGELEKIAPAMTPAQKLLNGTWDQDVIDALTNAGLDPEKFKGISGIGNMTSGWDDAVSQFQSSGKLIKGGVIEQALLQYGGTAGKTAVDRYGEGFNTISSGLLAETKAAMDKAYQDKVKDLLGDLNAAETKVKTEIQTLSDAITGTLDTVGQKITDAIAAAATVVTTEIDTMLHNLKYGVTPVITTTVPGGTEVGDDGTSIPSGNKIALPPDITVNINGDVYGNPDFDARVQAAVTSAWRSGGFAYMRA